MSFVDRLIPREPPSVRQGMYSWKQLLDREAARRLQAQTHIRTAPTAPAEIEEQAPSSRLG